MATFVLCCGIVLAVMSWVGPQKTWLAVLAGVVAWQHAQLAEVVVSVVFVLFLATHCVDKELFGSLSLPHSALNSIRRIREQLTKDSFISQKEEGPSNV